MGEADADAVISAQRFQLLFRGEVLEAFTPEQVEKAILERFRKPPEQIARLFSGGTHVLARNLTGADASKLAESLRALGAWWREPGSRTS